MVNEKQEKREVEKNVLFNVTMWPNPTIEDYIKTNCKVSNINRFITLIPFSLILLFSYFFEIFFKLIIFKEKNTINYIF